MTKSSLHKRLVEALLFAASEPLGTDEIQSRLPEGVAADEILAQLMADYGERGVNLVPVAGRWQFRTAPELGSLLRIELEIKRRLSRAALETLAIIAYHQPVTRAEIEGVRGVSVSKGTLDLLLELGWIKPRGHREAPGRPALWLTTDAFLEHFGLGALDDLPGMSELKASGLLDSRGSLPTMEGLTTSDAEPDAEDEADAPEPDEHEANGAAA